HLFFTTTSPTAIYPLSLHDALPIYVVLFRQLDDFVPESEPMHFDARDNHRSLARIDHLGGVFERLAQRVFVARGCLNDRGIGVRSEEHTSELQSRRDLVCRLLLEKK